jgi:hypothetical protein
MSKQSAAAAPEREASQSCCTAPHKQIAFHSALAYLVLNMIHIAAFGYLLDTDRIRCWQPNPEA